MKYYSRLNTIIGWIVLIFASAVYMLTAEASTSFWDCGEFIATGYKLEIGHPPGAPVFMIITRFFTLFASDISQVALMANYMSGIASGFTVLFLFWSVTHLARKIVIKTESDYTMSNIIAIIGSGLIGAVAFTFTDTIWFSAVEGEVYAMSSFFTAIVFWAILKWENEADEPHANRWIILIAYLMGLSIGVHLLNLLTIPAIVLVYYFRKYTFSWKGLFISLFLSILILAVIQYGVIQYVLRIASMFELMFVNSFGLPISSGLLFFGLVLVSALLYGIYFTHKKRKVLLNTILLSLTVILIGYSSFAIIVIRSLANPPMDENNPENFFSLESYVNREQYGDRPLMFGPVYNAPITGIKIGRPYYLPRGDKYVKTTERRDYEYDERFMMFFPRLYSRKDEHIKAYDQWAHIKGTPIQVMGRDGKNQTVRKPTFGENITYFIKYQIGHMYFRYFMWNFSGRQNDIQSYGEVNNGNWITGIKFIDELFYGTQDNLPVSVKDHKSRNKYYLLPFILGLIGMFYQADKNKKDFLVVLTLFFMTGIAILLYLNQPPMEPRERDYTYAGSFYAFAIWLGLGVLGIYSFLSSKIKKLPAAAISILLTTSVPVLLGTENWDDHDRSGRYTARDMAYNYLMSCAPNAILFTNGDNDTFPLWYLQEVEGVRTDVRVVNLMLLNTDWHIVQSKRKAYESDALPISMPDEKIVEGINNVVYIDKRVDRYVPIKEVIDFVRSDDPRMKVMSQDGERMDFIPTNKFILPINAAEVIKNGTVSAKDSSLILPEIRWEVNNEYFTKSELMVLDILANNNWKRPIYFVSPGRENTLGLDDYLQNEGYAYRLVPIRTTARGYLSVGRMNSNDLYNKVINVYRWGRMNEPDVYLGHFDLRTIQVTRVRNIFHQLADVLIAENKNDSALKVIDKAMLLMPHEKVPYDYYILDLIDDYYRIGATEKANKIVLQFAKINYEDFVYQNKLNKRFNGLLSRDLRIAAEYTRSLEMLAMQYGQNDLQKEVNTLFQIMAPVMQQPMQ